MTKITADYLEGMKAVNNLCYMLLYALKHKFPEARFSHNAGFYWWGFCFDEYKGLAKNQYFALMRMWKSGGNDFKRLAFTETIFDNGKYQDVFLRTLDLLETGFLEKNKNEQVGMIYYFLENCMNEALEWQASEERRQIVPARFWNGTVVRKHHIDSIPAFDRVAKEFVVSFPMQDEIFYMLEDAICEVTREYLKREASIEKNIVWLTREYRALQMKVCTSNGEIPEGSAPFAWRIYYEKPDAISFQQYDANKNSTKCILEFEMLVKGFFEQTEKEQTRLIKSFVNEAMHKQTIYTGINR